MMIQTIDNRVQPNIRWNSRTISDGHIDVPARKHYTMRMIINYILSFCLVATLLLNPLVTNGLSSPYQLDESTSIFRGTLSDFFLFFNFDENHLSKQNSPRLDAASCSVSIHEKYACVCWCVLLLV